MLDQRRQRWDNIDPALEECLLGYYAWCGWLGLKIPLKYKRVYISLHKVADMPFHVQDYVI